MQHSVKLFAGKTDAVPSGCAWTQARADLGRFAVRVFPTLALLIACVKVFGQETNSQSPTDYPSFRLISERNIFNPNRSSRSNRASRGETERRVKVESFALLGTLSYEKGTFAFFEGSSPEFQKVFKPADTIAGHKIVSIGADQIKLEAGGKQVDLPVGMQMKREDEGAWQVTARSESSRSGNPSAAAATASVEKPSGQNEKAGTGSSGDESDILKRLMQKREQEINK